ncbi:hypothetical protein [Pseudomonas sp. F16(2018)]|uniref:hypothetical protein n=1 Tax=Pseudomonas sp. F16(2018) TaxID=2093746 RepID=UPI0021144157|nr:hypothetical protein [Pseudomonas sp. F16(2018)]
MTKSADQEHPSPSSSLPAYVFEGPAQIAIQTRTDDQPRYVDTRLPVWTWYDGGVALKIDWVSLDLTPELNEIAKGFMAYALEKYAPQTAFMFVRSLVYLSNTALARYFPWDSKNLLTELSGFKKSRQHLIGFRRFYRWAVDRGIKGFDSNIYLKIKNVKSDRVDPYARIFLSQSSLELDEEIRLLKRIGRELSSDSWEEVQFNIVLHLAFELAPRSIQFHSLDIADFEFIESTDHEKYYTLWLPMAKKVSQRRPERRPRKITTRLGEKISRHVAEIQRRFGSDCEPVSSAADRAPADALVPMIQGLLLINSLGSAMAPLAISPMMTAYGEVGLFWAFAVINLAMVGFFLWRRGKRPAPEHPAPFAPTATFSPTGAELRVTEDLMHAAQEHPTLEAMDSTPGQPAVRADAQ